MRRVRFPSIVAVPDASAQTPLADSLLERARVAHREGRYEAAFEDLRVALEQYRAADAQRGVADVLRQTGFLYDDLGDYALALEHYLQALAIDEARRDDASRAVTLRTIGIVYSKSGDHLQGLGFYLQSLALARATQDERSVGSTLNNIGINSRHLGRLDESRAALDEALAIFERLQLIGAQGGVLSNLGATLEALGDIDGAERALRRAVDLSRRGQYAMGEINALRTLGRVLGQLDRFDEAERLLGQALDVAERVGAKPECAECHRAFSELYKRAGRPADALTHFETYHQLERDVFNETSDRKLKTLQVLYRVAQLERQSHEDGLTGLHNRRYFDATASESFATAQRLREPLALAVADVDDFKRINDRFSHALGDDVLREVARLMRAHLRDVDTLARWGGEEFAVLLPNTRAAAAHSVCERLRSAIAQHDWSTLHPELRVTLSIGLADSEGWDAVEQMFAAADWKLYRAKADGKNCVR